MTTENLTSSDAGTADGSSLLEVINVLLARKRLVFLLPLVAGVLMFGGSFLMKKQYTGSASFLPPTQNSPASALLNSIGGSLGGLGSVLSGTLGVKSATDEWIAILGSRTIADQIVDKYHLRQLYDVDLQKEARDVLASRSTITSDKSGLIKLDVDDEDPQRAAQIANDYVAFLTKLAQEQMVGDATPRRIFYQKQLAISKVNLEQAQAKLAKSGVAAETLKMSPDAAVTLVVQLKTQIAAQEIQVGVLSKSLTPNNAMLQQNTQALAELRAQLARVEASSGADGSPQGTEYTDIFRQFKYAEDMYEQMAKQYELARIDEAGSVADVQVIDQAVPPEKQSKPRRVLLAALVMVGTFLVMASWALLADSIARRRANPQFDAQFVRFRNQLRRSR